MHERSHPTPKTFQNAQILICQTPSRETVWKIGMDPKTVVLKAAKRLWKRFGRPFRATKYAPQVSTWLFSRQSLEGVFYEVHIQHRTHLAPNSHPRLATSEADDPLHNRRSQYWCILLLLTRSTHVPDGHDRSWIWTANTSRLL
jgi:hypothetical protein